MKVLTALSVVSAMLLFSACEKNTMSKIPYINFMSIEPRVFHTGDTVLTNFSLADGDADISKQNKEPTIFVRDNRHPEKGFYSFPLPDDYDPSIEKPKKGITGIITLDLMRHPELLEPKQDSAHKFFDTITYDVYVVDRAGHQSNTFTTPPVIWEK